MVPTQQVPIRLSPPVPNCAACGPTASYCMVGLQAGPEVDFLWGACLGFILAIPFLMYGLCCEV